MSRVAVDLEPGVDPIGDYIASLARSAAGDPTDAELARLEGLIDRGAAPVRGTGGRYAGSRKWNTVATRLTEKGRSLCP